MVHPTVLGWRGDTTRVPWCTQPHVPRQFILIQSWDLPRHDAALLLARRLFYKSNQLKSVQSSFNQKTKHPLCCRVFLLRWLVRTCWRLALRLSRSGSIGLLPVTQQTQPPSNSCWKMQVSLQVSLSAYFPTAYLFCITSARPCTRHAAMLVTEVHVTFGSLCMKQMNCRLYLLIHILHRVQLEANNAHTSAVGRPPSRSIRTRILPTGSTLAAAKGLLPRMAPSSSQHSTTKLYALI